ncbi:MAG: enterotoxin [Planctomycetota bacterium]
MTRHGLLVFALATLIGPTAASRSQAVEFPGPEPGKAVARLEDGRLVLENNVIAVTWNLGDRFELAEVVDRISEDAVRAGPGEALVITLADGQAIKASQLKMADKPTLRRLGPEPPNDPRRPSGWIASVPLVSSDGRLRVDWSATICDGANYVTQEVVLRATGDEVSVEQVAIVDLPAPEGEVCGIVEGSPVVAGTLFFACEHPMAANRVEEDGRVVCSARCYRPLDPKEPWTRSAVIGVVPHGQLRRGFQYYLERKRARPYGLFLHYNSWWDIAWADRLMNEKQCLDVIETFGRELIEKRGVKMDSFVFDDGWDDPKTLWGFHSGFPQGFTPLKEAAAKYDSALGTWFSPWGGYGQRKAQRLEYGKTQGFETNARGFSLAGPKYYARYRRICAEMIEKYGANYFKFDGIAQGIDSPGAGDEFAPDIEALLRLCAELRGLRPDVYLSITTGTWPSPYWLFYGDSVWRNGHDWNVHGAGSTRQQWITYRDMITYRMIVRRAPLYPINSLMTVTVCYGQLGTATRMASDTGDLVDEIRMAFGSGTQLLELYLTPQMMKPEGWDALADCAKWARANGDVLVDVHWIGGDPGEGEPYGYAAWSPRKGILVLRNPGDAPAKFELDLAHALELPRGGPPSYHVTSRWPTSERIEKLALAAAEPHTFELAPFEVLVLEAVPAQ